MQGEYSSALKEIWISKLNFQYFAFWMWNLETVVTESVWKNDSNAKLLNSIACFHTSVQNFADFASFWFQDWIYTLC